MRKGEKVLEEKDESKVVPIGDIVNNYVSFSNKELISIVKVMDYRLEVIRNSISRLEDMELYILNLKDKAIEELGEAKPPELTIGKLNDIQFQTILTVLNKHNNNLTRAARELGLSRRSLDRRIVKMKEQGYLL